jgi:hypothetical protein
LRDFTVPTGTPIKTAISHWVCPPNRPTRPPAAPHRPPMRHRRLVGARTDVSDHSWSVSGSATTRRRRVLSLRTTSTALWWISVSSHVANTPREGRTDSEPATASKTPPAPHPGPTSRRRRPGGPARTLPTKTLIQLSQRRPVGIPNSSHKFVIRRSLTHIANRSRQHRKILTLTGPPGAQSSLISHHRDPHMVPTPGTAPTGWG